MLGFYVLTVLYCSWGFFNIFAPALTYKIRNYNVGLSLFTLPYIFLLGSGFTALHCETN